MKYSLREIRSRVYALLDENEEILEERVEYGDPGMSPGGLVDMLVEDAARVVVCGASLSEIDECVHGEGSVTSVSPLTLRMELPADYLRLVYFEMDDWGGRGVQEPLAFGSEEQRLRQEAFSRGSRRRSRPAVSVQRRGDEAWLLVYGSRPGAGVAVFDYLAVPTVDNDAIDLPPRLMGAVCEKIAEMVKAVTGQD